MGASRFFVDGVHAPQSAVRLPASDAHKIVRVLRLTTGDSIRVVDSSGAEYEARLEIDGDAAVAHLGDVLASGDGAAVELTIAQGLPKGQKMDFVVEKASELGVRAVVPFVCERAVVRDAGDAKLERWRRIAKSAAEQSGRRTVLEVAPAQPFDALLRSFESYDLTLFPWEGAERAPLRETLPALLAGARRVLVVIGPEGGFSHNEADAALQAGARVISLGRRILRTETAGLYVATIVDFVTAN